ncbi:hypothetical protein SAMN04489761_1439 [Tenacibaculum sp. MAR_2009_124]|uniref:hypothetical protein n=1 Tax=Tenacibaculum sp. MAR_2009_124 TaxID=1250059 RepID=UPI000898DEE5|nr:hypothetical protein [Tenacibaculum sp. MAR_2009_124]SEB68467.1 hypothetical protein SAMN04489761_1439 [Tenacibaculum sp. MAR_2009_124]
MKLLKVLSLIFITTATVTSIAQEKQTNKESNLIKEQFEELYKKSSSYQKYKVIDKKAYSDIKRNVMNSLKGLESTINSKQDTITTLEGESNLLKSQISELNQKLEVSLAQENEISFLGIDLAKTSYNVLVWSIISILIILLVFFIYRFKNSNNVTKKTKVSLDEIEEEFDVYKRKSIENEQQLRRKLQDEINKQRGV